MSGRRLACLALSLFLLVSLAADWPVFRGNALQDGTSVEKLPAQLAELWQFKTGDGIEGAPAIADGVVYAGDLDGTLWCIDAASGKELWKYATESEISSGVSFAGDRVLFGCGDETL